MTKRIAIALTLFSFSLLQKTCFGSVANQNRIESTVSIIENVRFVGKFPAGEAEKILPLSDGEREKKSTGRFHLTNLRLIYEAKLGEFDSYVDTGEAFNAKSDYVAEFLYQNTVLRFSKNRNIWIFYRKGGFSEKDRKSINQVIQGDS